MRIRETISPYRLYRTVEGKTTVYQLIDTVTLPERDGSIKTYPTGIRPCKWDFKTGYSEVR